MTNTEANGNAWFVSEIIPVNNANDELRTLCTTNTKTAAVIDVSKFKLNVTPATDSLSSITLTEYKPNYLKYESNSTAPGIAVFSEIYYEKGWRAYIDTKEVPVLRANYVLRALEVPAGKHVVEFRFQPAAYRTGNTITTISSWLVLVLVLGCIAWSFKGEKSNAE
jgi:uncharacterized membrane protein YfhO